MGIFRQNTWISWSSTSRTNLLGSTSLPEMSGEVSNSPIISGRRIMWFAVYPESISGRCAGAMDLPSREKSLCLAGSRSSDKYGADCLGGTSIQRISAFSNSPSRLHRPKRCTRLGQGANAVISSLAEISTPASTTCVETIILPCSARGDRA